MEGLHATASSAQTLFVSLSLRVLLVLTVAVSSAGLLPATASAASDARAAAVAEPQVALATGAGQAAPENTLLAVAPPLMAMTVTPEVLNLGDVAGFRSRKLSRVQDAYVQLGQQASSAGNYIGAQAQGQRVFVDTSNRVVSILQGDRFLSIFRISRWDQFVATMEAQGLELAPGVTLEALQRAMGY